MASGGGGGGGGGPPPDLREALQSLIIDESSLDRPKKNYAFWSTQPVAQFGDDDAAPAGEAAAAAAGGPIEPPRAAADVPADPLPLPPSFEWCTLDVGDDAQLGELHDLLAAHYVEDDDSMFRFAYSPAFLRWALLPPGARREWHVGVRAAGGGGRLLAFISAIPAAVRPARGAPPLALVEINFLCVHKRLRQRRLAPVLIREITRRVNRAGLWQAVYTAGVVLPRPLAECQYWHRPLDPRKLIAVGFSRLAPRMTMARTLRLYRLPGAPATRGLRPMAAADVPAVAALLGRYLARFALAPQLSEADVEHWLLPRHDVVWTYVVGSEGGAGGVTDVLSFYTLPSTVIGSAEYSHLKAAYMSYVAATSVPPGALLADALVLAAAAGHDVVNALDNFENGPELRGLKFGPGDGKLRYYLFNWRAPQMAPGDVGLVML